LERRGECKQCGNCCRVAGWFLFANDPVMIAWLKRFAEDVKIQPSQHPGYVNISFERPCDQLNEDGTCRIHHSKPQMCTAHPVNADMLLPECGYRFE
jgi:Fe-S-cluster containining protein